MFGQQGSIRADICDIPQRLQFMHDFLDISLVSINQLKHRYQIPVLGYHFFVDELVAVRTCGFGGLVLEEFLHAGCAAAVEIGADDHRRVFISVVLAHAEEALLFYLVGNEGLDLLVHKFRINQLHCSFEIKYNQNYVGSYLSTLIKCSFPLIITKNLLRLFYIVYIDR